MTRGSDHSCVDLSILSIAARYREGSLRAVEVVDAFLDQIERRNGTEPSFDGAPDAINAWARIYADQARQAAKKADERIQREGEAAPLMCGIPVGLKDLFGVKGLPLTASSKVLEGNIADQDSAAWAQLHAEGAVLLGHTHTHEFAAGGTTDQVGNPWNLDHTAGGSSGGASAALASSMVPVGIGTDTAGSLRIPTALCGVASFKPSYGRVGLEGTVPLAPSLDHVGPMARTLQDCAVVLQSLTKARPSVTPWYPNQPADFEVMRPYGGQRPLEGMRIATTDRANNVELGPDIRPGYERAIEALGNLGATIVELPAPAEMSKQDYDTILLSEMRGYHAQYEQVADKYRPSTREFLNFGAPLEKAWDYITAQQRRVDFTARWQEWFEHHHIDAIVEPSSAVVAPQRGEGYDAGRAIGGTDPLTAFTATWNATGFPVAALPVEVGSATNLPVGVSIIGGFGQDQTTLRIGLTLEAQELRPLTLPG